MSTSRIRWPRRRPCRGGPPASTSRFGSPRSSCRDPTRLPHAGPSEPPRSCSSSLRPWGPRSSTTNTSIRCRFRRSGPCARRSWRAPRSPRPCGCAPSGARGGFPVGLEGTLKVFSLTDIFQMLGLQRKTGVLKVDGEDDTITISFLGGSVVAAESTARRLDNRLGNLLIRAGYVTQEQLDRVLVVQRETQQRMGFL